MGLPKDRKSPTRRFSRLISRLHVDEDALEVLALRGLLGAEALAHVVDREVDEVQRVADLVRHRRGEPSERRGALGEVQPLLEEAVLAQPLHHLVEAAGQAADLVAAARGDLHDEVARGHLPRGVRELPGAAG